MPDKNINLTDNEHDLLTELFNLGVGKAANSLSELVHQEVLLSVPSIRFASSETVINELGGDNNIVSVTQALDGHISMQSLLIFRPKDSFEVVKQMLNTHLSDEAIAELQSEALTEVGNIVLNACISVIADSIEQSFDVQLPIFRETNANELFTDLVEDSEDDIILFIEVRLELKESQSKGYLAFILNAPSMKNLHLTLTAMLEKLGAA